MPKNNVTSHYSLESSDFKELFTEDGFNRLRTYLGNVLKGQPKIYTAPFAKGQPIEDVLDDWTTTLKSIETKWPSLWTFENDLRAKVGPLSVQKPLEDRMTDVAHYFDDILLSSTQPVSEEAMKLTKLEFSRIRGLRMRSQQATVDKMKKSTNSGNPFFAKRRDVVQDTVPCQIWAEDNNTVWGNLLKMDPPGWEFSAVIGWRGQEGGPSEEDVKQRVVWMFPFAANIAELQVYQPLIEASQSTLLVPAWVSMDEVDERVTSLFDSKAKGDLIVCTDFSRFDQHFNREMQNAAKAMLEYILTPNSANREWLEEVFPIKYRIPLVISNSDREVNLLRGEHGMASGSGGTNVDETLAHRCLQHEAAVLAGEKLNPNSMCLGDDGILTYPGITVEDVVKAYESHGQECNISKQYASTQDCVFLRRWHHTDYRAEGRCVGVYSTYRAIGRLRYLERFMDPEYWSTDMVALRQLSIIENTKWHPLFEDFVQFCMKRDKYRLGIDIPGFLDRIDLIAKESIDHMPDFLGYTKTLQGEGTGLSQWRVVRYLKSIR
nr:MAG: putative RNA-dependent RNA polymerase [Picobirnavirus sp.]